MGGLAAVAAALAIMFLTPEDESRDFMAVRDASLRTELSQANETRPNAPTVPGFTLASARTDIVAGHPARVLVYKGPSVSITLCIWAGDGELAHGVHNVDYQGMQISYWNNGSVEFWAASAEPGPSLQSFVHALAPKDESL
jgi:anti-sigma factor RsiW